MLTPAPGDTVADTIAATARSMDPAEPLTFLRHFGDDDVFHRGPTPGGALFVVPGIWSGMPPRLIATTRARRACSMTGRCNECGECIDLATRNFVHEHWCHVPDDHLWPLTCAWLREVGEYARGRRIIEMPA